MNFKTFSCESLVAHSDKSKYNVTNWIGFSDIKKHLTQGLVFLNSKLFHLLTFINAFFLLLIFVNEQKEMYSIVKAYNNLIWPI